MSWQQPAALVCASAIDQPHSILEMKKASGFTDAFFAVPDAQAPGTLNSIAWDQALKDRIATIFALREP
jgi:hypothetical protein